jgi:hypothetical protein
MTFTVEQVVGTYVKLRRKKEALEASVKADVDEIKAKMAKLEAWLMQKADQDGVTSFKTTAGTAFVTTTDFANVADWDAVLSYIKTHDAYDMLEKRVSKTAVRAQLDETGSVPPGITYGTKIGINIRKPTGGDE